ncbi:hypothetical protein BT96DRAFT_975155 [Gymnopus androsaceus JB14]|uniref:Zn-dependent exopeptidase n=1 Tax=Gymnopus androsaceus JB14 TaxID=1447944 RepID=A0A6A4HS76_9AGAR|nr:hypothetical protein BT96DRAFT_975155 [Gymnopus androsaceus JB14]
MGDKDKKEFEFVKPEDESLFGNISSSRGIINQQTYVHEADNMEGMNPTLKPLMLAAHQDTVPVDQHARPMDPSSLLRLSMGNGYGGEERGIANPRLLGSSKGFVGLCFTTPIHGGVFANRTAVELLLQQGFKPRRTVVLAFGMDEEIGGMQGGPAVREFLLSQYGYHGFTLLIDEGTQFEVLKDSATIVVKPGVAEKGIVDVNPSEFPSPIPALILRARTDNSALEQLQEELLKLNERLWEMYMGNSQAVTAIGGGLKSNVLPTSAWALVDHRIAGWSSVEEIKSRYIDLFTPLTRSLNLSFSAFEESNTNDTSTESGPPPSETYPSNGHIELSSIFDKARDPSPSSPIFESAAWELLGGTVKGTLDEPLGGLYDGMEVKPEFVIGGTDTVHYTALTENIFRYAHCPTDNSIRGSYDINEAIRGKVYLEMIRFHGRSILNADETDLLG